jgi:type VI secretion system protein ImpH
MLPGFTNPRGQNNCLGKSVMLGHKGWFAQGKIRIILGPLNRQQLNTFAPGTVTLNALNEMVRFYINFEYDYEFIMRINRRHIPERMKLSRSGSPVMGWNTWLTSAKTADRTRDATLDIPVSSRRFR